MNKRRVIMLCMAVLMLLAVMPVIALAAPAPEPSEQEPVPQEQPEAGPAQDINAPDKLIIELGPGWAGVEFKLFMDVGEYPGTIVADENGVVTTELGGSKTYTLSCLTSAVPAPLPQASEPPEETPQESASPEPAESAAPGETPGQESEQPDEEDGGIPTMHIVLFLGGLTICIGTLVGMRIARNRRYAREAGNYDDDDDDE